MNIHFKNAHKINGNHVFLKYNIIKSSECLNDVFGDIFMDENDFNNIKVRIVNRIINFRYIFCRLKLNEFIHRYILYFPSLFIKNKIS